MPELDPRMYAGQVGGYTVTTSAEFTGAAAGYTAGANTVVLPSTGGLVELPRMGRIKGGTGVICSMQIYTDKKSITPRFRVHVSNANSPTVGSSGSAWVEKYADATKWFLHYDMPAMTTPSDATTSDTSRTWDNTMLRPYQCGAGDTSLWFIFEPLDSYVAAAGQKYTLMVTGYQD